MTERTRGGGYIDWERDNRWIKAAIEAAKLHDALVDILKIFNGIDLDTSTDCRALANSVPAALCRGIEEAYKEDPCYNLCETLTAVCVFGLLPVQE